jgi:hypothetical protein
MTPFGLFKTKPPIVTIRLTALEGAEHGRIDRPALVEALLKAWRGAMGGPPDTFDIDGPYGIAKGRGVGLQAFENKLRKKGHDAYHGYVAWDRQRAGFCVSFLASPPYSTSFVEIVLWFDSAAVAINAVDMVNELALAVRIDYGYVFDLPGNFSPLSEAPIKRGIFGSSIQVGGNALSEWNKEIHLVAEGGIRDIYPVNFLNSRQVDAVRGFSEFEMKAIAGGLHVLQVDDAAELANLKKRFRTAKNTSV